MYQERGVVWNDISRGYDSEDPNNKANVELKGEGVTVAVVDSGFNNPTVARDIQNKFGLRGTILICAGGCNSRYSGC